MKYPSLEEPDCLQWYSRAHLPGKYLLIRLVRQLCFDFPFQGLSVVTACFLLLATVILPDLSYPRHISRDNKCVKQRLLGACGVMIAICKESSFQCLHNVRSCGLPKCEPVYEMRTYHVTRGNRKVAFTERVTVNCICSQCGK